MLFDTHAHLNFLAYQADRDHVVARCLDKPMAVLNVGTQPPTSIMAVELARQNPGRFFASVGLHPVHVARVAPTVESSAGDDDESADYAWAKESPQAIWQQLSELASQPGVVAIGECGLDYYRLPSYDPQSIISLQHNYFHDHIALARTHQLPLIIHCRGAKLTPDAVFDDALEVLAEYDYPVGVWHCYGGSVDFARELINRGYYIGFTGIVTFKNAGAVHDVARYVPADRMLIETDCPYLTPHPYRGQRNEPAYVEYVAAGLAAVRGVAVEDVIAQTTANAQRLFNVTLAI